MASKGRLAGFATLPEHATCRVFEALSQIQPLEKLACLWTARFSSVAPRCAGGCTGSRQHLWQEWPFRAEWAIHGIGSDENRRSWRSARCDGWVSKHAGLWGGDQWKGPGHAADSSRGVAAKANPPSERPPFGRLLRRLSEVALLISPPLWSDTRSAGPARGPRRSDALVKICAGGAEVLPMMGPEKRCAPERRLQALGCSPAIA